MTEKILCDIYKSLKREEMYLYVDSRDGLARVPDSLLDSFGGQLKVTTLALSPERRLARAHAPEVLEAIREQGFYLQMPPARHKLVDAPMEQMGARNEKLPR